MKHKTVIGVSLVLLGSVSWGGPFGRSGGLASNDTRLAYRRIEAMVPMRDGTRLRTEIYVPDPSPGPLPFLINRTPYGASGDANGHPKLRASYKELADEGYIFVFQDIRGRYGSEGTFVMLRPPRDPKLPGATDEGTDAYDTIDWLIRSVPGNNGRAGMLGVSYDGWLTVQALLEPHPALKAVSPQASPADMYLGDDFFHDGAFRLSYGFEYAAMMETSKIDFHFAFDAYDTFEWYLKLGPLANVNAEYLHGRIPTWNDFVAHPNYDAFWRMMAVTPRLERVTVPTLNVAGWWDQEDFSGPLKIYAALESHDTSGLNYFVAGPWNHGGWARDGSRLGKIAFGEDTGKFFREKVQAPWFAHFLKDKGALRQPEALTFQTGSNRWEARDEWPPRRTSGEIRLYLLPGGVLSFDPPAGAGDRDCDAFVSDPSRPVPYRMRPIEPTYDPRGSGWPAWQVQDQRFVHLRPDVLTWETGPLAGDVVLTGDVSARLFASTTGTDADWIVKLIDVYPEDVPEEPSMGGYQLMIAGEVVRGRFRHGCERPEPVPAGAIEEYAVDLRQHDHRFLKGHRIMVQVQSTWFPLIDRNPQTYAENIFLAGSEAYRPATHRVFGTKAFPSHVRLMSPSR